MPRPLKKRIMDLFDAINQRYCYRGEFKDAAISRQDLCKIVAAGMSAPSGKNAQTTSFVIVDDPQLLKKIGQLHEMPAMRTAKAMIACLIDKTPPAVYAGHTFQVEDCAAAVQNILLAMTALGYAGVWIDGWLRLNDHSSIIGEVLAVPTEKTVRVLIPLGVPVTAGPRQDKKKFEARACFNKFI